MKQSKIAIIGAGVVGSTTAYTLMLKGLVSHISLVDVNDIKCKGEIYDLSDALSFSSASDIKQGTLGEAGQADIAIITAGIAQKPGQTRVELLHTNIGIIKDVIKGMQPLNPHLIIIVVTNPVDILTYAVQRLSGLPHEQIFGSGTLLDTQRLRDLIGNKLGIAQQSIHLYLLGEHGDSQFAAWSSGTIAGVPVLDFPGLDQNTLKQMADHAKHKAYDIIECKGSTAFGIAACVSAYCENIIFDKKRIAPVSCYVKEFDLYLSMPAVLGAQGVDRIIMPRLNDDEQSQLQQSAATLRAYINELPSGSL